MYTPGIKFERTDAECRDLTLSWERDDKAFFTSGACHILAFSFLALHPKQGYEIIFIKPRQNSSGAHVYVSNSEWAFDFNGWTKEEELLSVTKKAERELKPDWDFERVVIDDDLETFCRKNHHRPPAYYAQLPWVRAHDYIKRFTTYPPVDS